ncbi:MAG: hypothetical protein ACI8XW_000385, partial [Gammaproteobacteria bacterium]
CYFCCEGIILPWAEACINMRAKKKTGRSPSFDTTFYC